ncbi:hypothetical protein [Methanonatronarchaeum sp. AMET6-2]|uniref:hypothetical protein n=1 Tax=Methanonatronarchaeum sp. AMET6-2 TaxID=2933293 RepID=UPI001FF4A4EC|nr:hypothetical protein [Methanonatronarchaeum sp. AMET6-2]UOY10002.1 hypothetical protein MU439_07015 [Methanonatronarchaeum sp. AMET6-2]
MNQKNIFFKEKLQDWFYNNSRNLPWRKANPYGLMIGEIMLQRTRAENVLGVYQDFIERFENPCELAKAETQEIKNIIKPIGMQKRKTRALRETGMKFCEKGNIKNKDEIISIHGVGDYVANAYLSIAFNKPLPIIDTNVKRIYSRYFSIKTQGDIRKNQEIQEFAENIIPETNPRDYNLALLDFGAIICKKINPECTDCILNQKCEKFNSKQTEIE